MAQCRDVEGFAPFSRLRDFDLTLCFEEGILNSSVLGVLLIWSVLGSLSLFVIEPKARAQKSRLILAAKLTLLFFAFASSVATLILTLLRFQKTVGVLEAFILEPVAILASLFFSYYNHTRARKSASVLLLFWPIYTLCLGIWARTVVLRDFDQHRLLLILKGGVAFFGLASFLLECIGPEIGLAKDEKSAHENPILTANIFSEWTFGWMTDLMAKGASKFITEDDLPSLVPSDESENLGNRLQRYLVKHGVWRSLALAYGGPFFLAAFIKIIQDCLAFLQPQLLRLLLAYIARYQGSRFDDSRPNPLEGFLIAVTMFVASVIQTILLNQYFQRAFTTGMRVRAGLVTAIFSKALILSNDENGRSSGDIVNLMSVDAIRMQDLCTYALIAISGPFQITLAFISLYNLLGWASFVGVGVMIASLPLSTFIARILKRMQEQQMKNRDQRTRLMSELLSNIKSIKLYAWESAFIQKIFAVRNDKELRMLRKIGLLNSFSTTLWTGIPLLVAFASFATAASTSSRPLTSDVIFPAISLFMLLQFPLAMFSQVISNLIEAFVSVKRLSAFFQASELQPDAREIIQKPDLKQGDEVLVIKDADFRWDSKNIVPTLENINLTVRKGELTAVMGRVGAGKTSLLSAIIGDLSRKEGKLTLFGSVSYAPQNPWIMSATVRENITFNHLYEETFYQTVLEACALGPDIALLPQGDLTEVGEKGITLSGGQRARISLARAVYARADLVLLDDCLAAVDSHVARHVFDQVIGPQGLLANQARILVTNSIAFVKQFDQVAFISRGIIRECGSYQTLMENSDGDLNKLVRGHGTSSSSSGTSTPFVVRSGNATPTEDLSFTTGDKISEYAGTLSEKLRHRASYPKAVLAPPKPVRAANSAGLSQEHREQGRVKRRVYLQYIEAASKIGFIGYMSATIAQQAMTLFGNLALRSWGEHNLETGDNSGMFKYLLIYGLFSLSATLLGGISNVIMWILCSLRSSKRLHDSMLTSLMNAPLGYFEQTPTGRTLNLFSRDIYVVDALLGRFIQNLFRTGAVCFSIVIIIGASFPLFLLSIPPLLFFYLRVMKYYLATSRELKRLDAVSKSPIFAWFSESLAGVSTIRSFNQQSIFIKANERHIDRNQICYLPSISVNRWLAVRLEIVGAVIILVVAVLAMVALITTGVDAGLVGLVLSYAMNATSSLNWVVRSASDVEQNIVSVERILHQIDVPPEAPQYIPEAKTKDDWPSQGKIEFRNYSTRYRPELDLVLNNISLTINPKEKLGVCGRTGAGKSSLLLALFRIIEGVEGSIVIDGVDIKNIGLNDLRSSISIVPQMPDLFEGTLRENIDPIGQHDDADIWIALGQAHLREYVESLPERLDAPVREGGQSLSSGQRQLLCFARALLRKSKILVLDEATSAVDLDTDKAIQDIIQGPAFADTTIITIAHRLNTIIGGSRILVMDQGKVAEFDSPQNLIDNKSSIFYSLATEAGLT
ncbi:P-loop containing nucleoside triphosphate hydrolase protein [Mycena albidolilacea]|uniref:P-loop containing nucleoside triphosphate hydrolase protein n=1 Tax=Mycena albidolilacea TaxID=1033008 RepID=A0AAD7ACW4_9AGAR|nr:P-loop containing nucleoside triphosphate hydrolase protein [Mycena albidolilacea]